jgi:hypothetical protein
LSKKKINIHLNVQEFNNFSLISVAPTSSATTGRIIYMKYILRHSFCLKVKCLDWHGKDEYKKQWDPNNHYSNDTQKVMSIPKVTPDEIFHSFTRLKYVLYISILWSNQSIQGPSNGATPVVPPPPNWYPLS